MAMEFNSVATSISGQFLTLEKFSIMDLSVTRIFQWRRNIAIGRILKQFSLAWRSGNIAEPNNSEGKVHLQV
jgi:hypothetical protein